MWRGLNFALALLWACCAAQAQVVGFTPIAGTSGAAAAYVGPCDMQTCKAFGGFAAGSVAYIGQNAVRATLSGGSTQDFALQSNGFVSESALTSFCGSLNTNACGITIWDQVANTITGTSAFTNGNGYTNYPQLIQSAVSGHSCALFAHANSSRLDTYYNTGFGSSVITIQEIFLFNTSASSQWTIAGGDNSGSAFIQNPSSTSLNSPYGTGSPLTVTGLSLTSVPTTAELIVNGASSNLSANSATPASGTLGTLNTFDGVFIGAPSTPDLGYFCEMAVFASALTPTNTAALIANARLSNRWNY